MAKLVKVRTVDLKPGDVVVFGNERNLVTSLKAVEGSCLVRVNVRRTLAKVGFFGSYETWFNAGNESVQEVERA